MAKPTPPYIVYIEDLDPPTYSEHDNHHSTREHDNYHSTRAMSVNPDIELQPLAGRDSAMAAPAISPTNPTVATSQHHRVSCVSAAGEPESDAVQLQLAKLNNARDVKLKIIWVIAIVIVVGGWVAVQWLRRTKAESSQDDSSYKQS